MTTTIYRIIRKSSFGDTGKIFYTLTGHATVDGRSSTKEYEFPVDAQTFDQFNIGDAFAAVLELYARAN